MQRLIRVIFLWTLLLLVSVIHSSYENKLRRVLVLHSYSPSMSWVDEMNEGIRGGISSEHSLDIHLAYEFLDAKRFNSEMYFKHISEALKFKYDNIKFDAIISCDDHSIDFLVNYREQCFPGVPIFFCGVSNDTHQELKNQKEIRGIFELNPVKKNLDLILSLLPETKEIYIVADPNTKTNRIYRNYIEREFGRSYRGAEINLSRNQSFHDLEEKLSNLPDKTVIFYFSYLVDSEGSYLPHLLIARRLLRRCNVPVFVMNKLYLDCQVIGGYVTDPKAHAEAVTTMAVDYLHGIALKDIRGNDYSHLELYPALFNHRMFEIYELSENKLPDNAEFYDIADIRDKHRSDQFMIMSFIMIFLTVFVLFMIYLNSKYSRSKTKFIEKRSFWEGLADNLPVVFFELDTEGKFLSISNYIKALSGVDSENIVGKTSREAGLNESFCILNEHLITLINQEEKNYEYDVNLENPLDNYNSHCRIYYRINNKRNQAANIQGIILDRSSEEDKYNEITKRLDFFEEFWHKLPLAAMVVKLTDEFRLGNELEIIKHNTEFEKLFGDVDKEKLLCINNTDCWLRKAIQEYIDRDNSVSNHRIAEAKTIIRLHLSRKSDKELIGLITDITEREKERGATKEIEQKKQIHIAELEDALTSAQKNIALREKMLISSLGNASLGKIIKKKMPFWQTTFDSLAYFIESINGNNLKSKMISQDNSETFTKTFAMIRRIQSFFTNFNGLYLGSKKERIFELRDVLLEISNFWEESLKKQNITINQELQRNCYIKGKVTDINQVMNCLIENSMEAIETAAINKGELEISLSRDEDYCYIRVKDNAGGIPSSYHEKVFMPFFTTKYSTEHAGLGLFIGKKIIEDNLKGSIQIKNIEKTSEFLIRIKLCLM